MQIFRWRFTGAGPRAQEDDDTSNDPGDKDATTIVSSRGRFVLYCLWLLWLGDEYVLHTLLLCVIRVRLSESTKVPSYLTPMAATAVSIPTNIN